MSIAVRKPRPQAVSETARLFADDVLAGLAADPKRLPPKYFYDQAGSELFQRITALPEYYPTRTEVDILEAHSGAIAKLVPPDAALVEFGASSAVKARILLRTAPQFAAYVPVDISGEFPPDEIAQLQQEFPRLKVAPVTADFSKPFKLPQILGLRPRVGFFPGSTIGNFEPHEANALMRQAATLLGPGALFIVGIDLVKDPDILTAAYNDGAGVTAAFNLNLLTRINRELGGDFDLSGFRHRAFYNQDQRRVEMHLVSVARQKVRVCDKSFEFRRGETIHTENSYKYTADSFRCHARGAGWTSAATYVDADGYFSVHVLKAKIATPADAATSSAF